jgi:hypothetical protein
MGTILRTADWFGIRKVVCSEDCVDVFNPKVVQASMGSFARVVVYETDLRHSSVQGRRGCPFTEPCSAVNALPARNFPARHPDHRNESQGNISGTPLRKSPIRCSSRCFFNAKDHAESLNASIANASSATKSANSFSKINFDKRALKSRIR